MRKSNLNDSSQPVTTGKRQAEYLFSPIVGVGNWEQLQGEYDIPIKDL